ncbi:MAG: CvpA family protein [Magnetococcales bacterium]|nr:CvpA family protein [Magnetococcales bacterium]
MNALDIFFLTVLGISGILAVLRGFLREVVGLLGWALAFVVASRFFGDLSIVLADWIHQAYLVKPIAFFLIFVSTLLAAGFLGQKLQTLADQSGLTVADRFMGLCFGLARGLLVLLIGFILFKNFYQGEQPVDLVAQSVFSPHLAQAADWMSKQFSPDWVMSHANAAQTSVGKMFRPTHP